MAPRIAPHGGCEDVTLYSDFYDETYFNSGTTFPWMQKRLAQAKPTRIYRPQLRNIRPLIKHGGKILDIACAFGAFLDEVQRKFNSMSIRLTGMDASSYAIERAKNFFPTIDFIHADITKPLPEHAVKEKFDFISARNLLEHLSDEHRKIFYKNARQLLADGGHLYIEVPNFQGIPRYIDPSWFIHPAHQKQDYTDKVLADELRKEGFSITTLDGMDILIIREMNYDIHAKVAWFIDLPNIITPPLIKRRFFRSIYVIATLR
ncbi:class I SAM-dependent methyltransferase [Candidatus Peregrinibacteria bacterium]|nr:class I SAM-dependent methyltransferase [Candidatus Peregrinibacteria bacterium]